jgi:hypothetical protein
MNRAGRRIYTDELIQWLQRFAAVTGCDIDRLIDAGRTL